MATWTKAELAQKVLEYVGVVPAGQSASSEDSTLAEGVIDSVHAQLDSHDHSKVPFATSAIPEWAQQPMVKYVAVEVGPYFGKPYPEQHKATALRELEAAGAGHDHPVQARARYF